MAAPLGSYSPNDVTVAVNGIPLDGFGPDSFVTVSHNSDMTTLTEGADGSPAIAIKKGMRGGTISLTLLQTSLANSILNGYMQAQKYAPGAPAPLNVTIRNNQGGELHTMPAGFLQKEPEAGFGVDVGTREWVFIGQLAPTFAGNAV